MSNIDNSRETDCKRCIAEGIDPPFRGNPGQLGNHSRNAHPRSSSSTRAPRAEREAAAAVAAAGADLDAPPDALGAPNAGDYVRDDERVPGGGGAPSAEPRPGGMFARVGARIWGRAEEEPTVEARAGVPVSARERRPVKSTRSSTAPVFEMVWRWVGMRLERTNIDPAVGRTLVWQSALAGETLERSTKGTIIDRLVQPFAARVDELEVLGALFGLPAMIGYLERNPLAAPVVVPVVADMLEVHLHAMVPVIKKQREKRAKVRDAARELYPDLPADADPTAHVLAELFAGTVFETGFGPDEIAAWSAMMQTEPAAPPAPEAAA